METLMQGSTGPQVAAWQSFLNSQGFNVGAVDGDFGPDTTAATQQFQAANGLTADGVVGPQTLASAVADGFTPGAGFDPNAAAQYAIQNAQPSSTGQCAKYVRLAINAGGVALTPTPLAKDYGQSLIAGGFGSIQQNPQGAGPGAYQPAIGDVVVFQPYPGQNPPDGHMEIYTPQGFVSDFIQMDPFYPNSSPSSPWQTEKPSSEIFRFPTGG